MLQLSNIHYFLIIATILFIIKNLKKPKTFFILFTTTILYFFCDTFRFLASDTKKDIILFGIKDFFLLFFILIFINKKLLNIFISFYNKNKLFVILSIIFICVNFIIINDKFLFFLGMYEYFYLPLIFILLMEIEFNYDEISEIFKFIFLILLSIYSIQLVDINFYVETFLNNFTPGEINSLWERKAYNPRINDSTAEFIHQFPSIFNNSGRLNHFNTSFFGIIIILYAFKKEKFYLIFGLLFYILILINSSRFTLILTSSLIILIFFENFKNKLSKKNGLIIIVTLMILYGFSFIFFNKFHYNQYNKNIQSNKGILIIYHNFYEPITSAFDKTRVKTASSFIGRIKMIDSELHSLIFDKDVKLKNILFGNGIGTHSLVTKHYLKNFKYMFENSLVVFLYEIGVIGIIIIFFIYSYFSKFVLTEVIKIKSNFYLLISKVILLFPIILLFTGHQFYRDYAFQFFFFFSIGMVIKLSKYKKNL